MSIASSLQYNISYSSYWKHTHESVHTAQQVENFGSQRNRPIHIRKFSAHNPVTHLLVPLQHRIQQEQIPEDFEMFDLFIEAVLLLLRARLALASIMQSV